MREHRRSYIWLVALQCAFDFIADIITDFDKRRPQAKDAEGKIQENLNHLSGWVFSLELGREDDQVFLFWDVVDFTGLGVNFPNKSFFPPLANDSDGIDVYITCDGCSAVRVDHQSSDGNFRDFLGHCVIPLDIRYCLFHVFILHLLITNVNSLRCMKK
ncbi:MAG: hypothetical protein A3C50_01720 [Candidatus Staskawiczbacteria bacterium RIFCSPHIGHO2_02_FULL_43_16]|uniref:Uncharacterized protein n=1 Tax=Candidatus Staskawiczbacteria bacterium RIFCSPHIGHO2_01_FULL_41_41 TaxID=1802203 RepID=A0A1G2HUV6_9BACT|nr:MAG: hypothetical protein A2822_04140 [Candidatus Staskawiczbacteria bacterium RIFCSPHIGHO2_01_FULL_41_41]OGZ69098.1 MAG: hypothetical protein A3C50_01720 [Candidatus Staskawiczbacteria bacterium RIFCSPHIGHO2_02_FULL_43_16]OGZ74475.1 MAG: hypothetical protein A3A12_01770 [Candidatus Staskawiczbacteria bacterium RIFCSPLOWO2_01_FULL_43_17b]